MKKNLFQCGVLEMCLFRPHKPTVLIKYSVAFSGNKWNHFQEQIVHYFNRIIGTEEIKLTIYIGAHAIKKGFTFRRQVNDVNKG